MKNLHFCLLLIVSFLGGCREYIDSIKIEQGLFKGHTVHFDEKNQLWIIDGDINKAPKAETYKIGNNAAPGITFDIARDYPENFKKIYWMQNIYGLDSTGYSNLKIEEPTINGLLKQGFGVMSSSKGVLLGKSNGDLVLFHPKIPNSAKEFCKVIKKEPSNQYEIGALLGYRMQDAYAWCFGVEEARKAYPNKKFRQVIGHEGYEEIYDIHDWKSVGLSRLKSVLGDELKYIISGDEPKA